MIYQYKKKSMKRNNLKYLLSPWMKHIPDIHIINLIMDSRKLIAGDLFIAVNGTKKDGHAFISEAIQKKSSAILYDTKKKNNMEN